MKRHTIPNFFIVGAPKCGTTALSEYLREHPRIFMSYPKEPHFFAEDLPSYRMTKSLDEYLGLFRKAGPEHIAIGEASVFYLFSKTALNLIHNFNPEAKIIVMLRNPVDLVHSLHSQLLYTLDEDENDFEAAWDLQQPRANGSNIPAGCREPALLQYARMGMLGEQVEHLFRIFSRNQVKILLFDDFVDKTSTVYEDVLSFLGVPSDGRTVFQVINESKVYRRKWLTRFVHRPSERFIRFKAGIKKAFGIDRLWLWETVKKISARKQKRSALSAKFRRQLTYEFQRDIEKLSNLIGRDLSSWVHSPESGPRQGN